VRRPQFSRRATAQETTWPLLLLRLARRFCRNARRVVHPRRLLEGTVVKGRIVASKKTWRSIDVGAKTEGRVALKEFAAPGRRTIEGWRTVEVYLTSGRECARRSRAVARQGAAAKRAGQAGDRVQDNERSPGHLQSGQGAHGRSRRAVGVPARSQVDIRPIRDVTPLNERQPAVPDPEDGRRRGNIVVSRPHRAGETAPSSARNWCRTSKRVSVIDGSSELTDYGAFVDSRRIEACWHVTDIAWRPRSITRRSAQYRQSVKVKIIKITTRPTDFARHEAVAGPIRAGNRGQVSGPGPLQGRVTKHNRLRGVRRTGAGHRKA